VSDEPLYRPATYGDESYEPDPRHPGAHVHATFAHDCEMTWHAALLAQMRRREVKYAHFRKGVSSLPSDLVNRVRAGMSQALVVIVDDREHMTRLRAAIENRVGVRLQDMQHKARAKMELQIHQAAGAAILRESPLGRIEIVTGVVDLAALASGLGKRRNNAVMAARAAAAFQELLAPIEERVKISGQSLFVNEHPDIEVLRRGGKVSRIFDIGNEKATGSLRAIRDELESLYGDEFDDDPSGVTIDADSSQSAHVGAGDLASGWARALYEEDDGLRKVTDVFRLVVLNGKVVSR
jgi:hypothetical protein